MFLIEEDRYIVSDTQIEFARDNSAKQLLAWREFMKKFRVLLPVPERKTLHEEYQRSNFGMMGD